jgi:hypothetical protein
MPSLRERDESELEVVAVCLPSAWVWERFEHPVPRRVPHGSLHVRHDAPQEDHRHPRAKAPQGLGQAALAAAAQRRAARRFQVVDGRCGEVDQIATCVAKPLEEMAPVDNCGERQRERPANGPIEARVGSIEEYAGGRRRLADEEHSHAPRFE